MESPHRESTFFLTEGFLPIKKVGYRERGGMLSLFSSHPVHHHNIFAIRDNLPHLGAER